VSSKDFSVCLKSGSAGRGPIQRKSDRLRMGTVLKNFAIEGFRVSWVNALSKVGYVIVSKEPPEVDFVGCWTWGERIGQFFREEPRILAQDVGFHYLERPGRHPELFVLPRYAGDFEPNETVYNIIEADTQDETSSPQVILPLAETLEAHLNKFCHS
jgi:hypothetical protein